MITKSMTIEEYHLLPLPLGWKIEYWDGAAQISARSDIALFSVTTDVIRSAPIPPGLIARAIEPADQEPLTLLHNAAFAGTIDYWNRSEADIDAEGRQFLAAYFAGNKGQPLLGVSFVACLSETPTIPIGATLITRQEAGPIQELLMVDPAWQRCGVAAALVARACEQLHRLGEPTLWSMCHLGNEKSVPWYHRFGFVEEPDLLNTRKRLRIVQHELWRGEQMSNSDAASQEKLLAEKKRLQQEVERLEQFTKQQGIEAACPLMRWR